MARQIYQLGSYFPWCLCHPPRPAFNVLLHASVSESLICGYPLKENTLLLLWFIISCSESQLHIFCCVTNTWSLFHTSVCVPHSLVYLLRDKDEEMYLTYDLMIASKCKYLFWYIRHFISHQCLHKIQRDINWRLAPSKVYPMRKANRL